MRAVTMRAVVAILFGLAAACAGNDIDHSKVMAILQLVKPIDGAPVPQPASIIYGVPTTRGEIPYQAAMYLDGWYFCGGSLISDQWVLTAAHCAKDFTTFTVYLGATQLNWSEPDRVIITTRTKVVHSGFDLMTFSNDVALVNLGQPVSFSVYIQPVTLASDSAIYVGNSARASGWGGTSRWSGVSSQLHKEYPVVISNAECQQTFGSIIVSSTLCAQGISGRSTCNGDSGGPLIDVGSGRQIGIISFVSSYGCALGYPMGFARVTSFRAWIALNSGF